jgi:hypothetical protein
VTERKRYGMILPNFSFFFAAAMTSRVRNLSVGLIEVNRWTSH